MKFECELIQDLLPLYVDEVCSKKSKAVVEEHMLECKICKEQLSTLRNHTVTEELSDERNRVIGKILKKEKKRSTMIGMFTAGVLMIPLIVCLICNLATGHALDWFFIVLASLMVFASVTVVPLLASEQRFLWTICSFTVSLVILLGTICIYTGGRWFYIAVVPSVLGMLICFMPVLVRCMQKPRGVCNHKALITMLVDSVAVFGIVIAAGMYTNYPGYWKIAIPITSYGLLVPWVMVMIMRYFPIPKIFRAAITSMVTGVLLAFMNDVINWSIGEFRGISLKNADFLHWNEYTNDGNLAVCYLIIGTLLALLFTIFGCMRIRGNMAKSGE